MYKYTLFTVRPEHVEGSRAVECTVSFEETF